MTFPSVGRITPSSNLASVVLPDPLSPATAVMLATSASIANETSSTATVRLARLNNPPPKTLVTDFNSNRFDMAQLDIDTESS